MWVNIEDENEALAIIAKLRGQREFDKFRGRVNQTLIDFKDENHDKFVTAARELYAQNSNDDIEVDDDAAISHSEKHSFVHAWVCVRNAEAGIVEGTGDESSVSENDVGA